MNVIIRSTNSPVRSIVRSRGPLAELSLHERIDGCIAATDSKKRFKRNVLPDQSFRLVSLLLSRIVRVMLEIFAVQQAPIDLPQVVQIRVIARHRGIGVLIL